MASVKDRKTEFKVYFDLKRRLSSQHPELVLIGMVDSVLRENGCRDLALEFIHEIVGDPASDFQSVFCIADKYVSVDVNHRQN